MVVGTSIDIILNEDARLRGLYDFPDLYLMFIFGHAPFRLTVCITNPPLQEDHKSDLVMYGRQPRVQGKQTEDTLFLVPSRFISIYVHAISQSPPTPRDLLPASVAWTCTVRDSQLQAW